MSATRPLRWLLASVGSNGDLHPFLALGRGLRARGHQVSLLGHADWREQVEAAGLCFLDSGEPSRGDFLAEFPQLLSQRWRGIVSFRTLMARLIAPGLEPFFQALRAASAGHDVLVAHHFVFAAPLVAELTSIPWATVSLAPGVIPSAYTLPGGDGGKVRHEERLRHRLVWSIGRQIIGRLADPWVNALRCGHGLAPQRDVVFSGTSSRLNLQLYSSSFAPRPPDWSGEKRLGGFCFYDPPGALLPSALEHFLQAGPPPVLFTLGSTVVHHPGSFYASALEALRMTGLRGILLVGADSKLMAPPGGRVMVMPYAPYGLLMPRVRAVVHQCGIGTLSHALRAGIPSVACPHAFDQPNNARRLEALGLAEVLPSHRRGAKEMAQALRRLLAGPAPELARRMGITLRGENGVATSCDILEETFAPPGPGPATSPFP